MDIRRKEQNERRAKTQIQGNLFSSHCGKQIMEQEETLVDFFNAAESLAKNSYNSEQCLLSRRPEVDIFRIIRVSSARREKTSAMSIFHR